MIVSPLRAGQGNQRQKKGWTGPAGTTERGEEAVRSPAQSPSQSAVPPCPAVPDVSTTEGTHTAVTVFGLLFCHISLGTRNEEMWRYTQIESLIIQWGT